MVWCRNQKIYNLIVIALAAVELWFGVGIKRYTTERGEPSKANSCGLV